MGLLVSATVATGARAKNILILLASSGIVEKAMKAAIQEWRTVTHQQEIHNQYVFPSYKAWSIMQKRKMYIMQSKK